MQAATVSKTHNAPYHMVYPVRRCELDRVVKPHGCVVIIHVGTPAGYTALNLVLRSSPIVWGASVRPATTRCAEDV